VKSIVAVEWFEFVEEAYRTNRVDVNVPQNKNEMGKVIGLPAIQAVMWQATLPAISALRTTSAKSLRRCGAMAFSAPSWMPIAPRLPKPHSR